MNNQLSEQTLHSSQALLNELFEAVRVLETPMSSGTKLGPTGKVLQSLRESSVSFGNPRSSLVALTPKLFAKFGMEVDGIIKQQLRERYNFYYLVLPVSFSATPGLKYKKFECAVTLGPAGSDEPIIHSLEPKNEWKELFALQAGLKLGLDAMLNWSLIIDPTIPASSIPAELRARVKSANEAHIKLTLPDFKMPFGYDHITVAGEGNSACRWVINSPAPQGTNDVQFKILFKTPKSLKSIRLEGVFGAVPALSSNPDIRSVFRHLSVKLQALVRGENLDHELAVGDHEAWDIELPT